MGYRAVSLRTVVCLLMLQVAEPASAVADFVVSPNISGGFGNYYWSINVEGAASAANPALYLARNQTYTFNVSTNVNHPFWIDDSPGTGGATIAYSGTGLSGSPASNGVTSSQGLTFNVPEDAPDALYYACGFHHEMHGTIYIVVFRNSFD